MDNTIESNSKLSEYVVDGATLNCSRGSASSILAMPESHGMFLKGRAQCNIADHKSMANILSFGTCSATMSSCTPRVTLPWVNNQNTTLLIDDEKALIQDANAFCAVGGIISIRNSGQI